MVRLGKLLQPRLVGSALQQAGVEDAERGGDGAHQKCSDREGREHEDDGVNLACQPNGRDVAIADRGEGDYSPVEGQQIPGPNVGLCVHVEAIGVQAALAVDVQLADHEEETRAPVHPEARDYDVPHDDRQVKLAPSQVHLARQLPDAVEPREAEQVQQVEVAHGGFDVLFLGVHIAAGDVEAPIRYVDDERANGHRTDEVICKRGCEVAVRDELAVDDGEAVLAECQVEVDDDVSDKEEGGDQVHGHAPQWRHVGHYVLALWHQRPVGVFEGDVPRRVERRPEGEPHDDPPPRNVPYGMVVDDVAGKAQLRGAAGGKLLVVRKGRNGDVALTVLLQDGVVAAGYRLRQRNVAQAGRRLPRLPRQRGLARHSAHRGARQRLHGLHAPLHGVGPPLL
mmetsp:Transcript_29894/g.76681  ORF Transcript_29894/g.76681 Transcript_29894/m.76681 type:complete len:396 (-) Transcript_29894:654-1841(-)